MADNPVLPAVGVAVAADDIGGVLYQRVKLVHGSDGTNNGDASLSAPFPVVTESRTIVASAEFSRPADTTAYAVNDVVSDSTSAPTIMQFTLARANGGAGYISKARIETNDTADVARYRLHLFHTAPTMINDNSPMTVLWANRDKRVGAVDFDPLVTGGSGSDAARQINTYPLFFKCAVADAKLYGILEILTARTPASGKTYFIELSADLTNAV